MAQYNANTMNIVKMSTSLFDLQEHTYLRFVSKAHTIISEHSCHAADLWCTVGEGLTAIAISPPDKYL